ncbi:hypothetical protein [Campylobacter troglodytis]|nr:hypothetical protein [Campylobacter troglodytis]
MNLSLKGFKFKQEFKGLNLKLKRLKQVHKGLSLNLSRKGFEFKQG